MRNHIIDSQKRRKLERSLLGLQILVFYTALKLLAYGKEVYKVEKPKQYYLDNIFFYNLYGFF